jgi:hypothetical protein
MTEENKKKNLFSINNLYKHVRSFVGIYLEPQPSLSHKKNKKDRKRCDKCGHYKCHHSKKHKKEDKKLDKRLETKYRNEIQEREEEYRRKIIERKTPISKFDNHPYERDIVILENQEMNIKKMDVEFRLSDDIMSFSPHYRKEENSVVRKNIEMEIESGYISEWNQNNQTDMGEEMNINEMDVENEDSDEEDVNCDCAYHRSLRERKNEIELLDEIDDAIH